MSADGTDPIFLIPSSVSVWEPFIWTPDGRYVAFRNYEQSGSDLANVQNGAISELIEDGLGPAWSPDGNKIAFYKSGPMGIGRIS